MASKRILIYNAVVYKIYSTCIINIIIQAIGVLATVGAPRQ